MHCRHVKGKRDGKSVLGSVEEKYQTAFGHWGDWGSPVKCPEGSFVIGLKVKEEAYDSGISDFTAINGMSMACRYSVVGGTYPEIPGNVGMTTTDYEHYLIADQYNWGAWTGWATCKLESYMCGFSVKIEANQGTSGDDTAMNGIKLICCRMPWDTESLQPEYVAPVTQAPAVDPSHGWDIMETHEVATGTFGDWTAHGCPKDHYATSLRLRAEADQGSEDDTSLNGIQMRCRHVQGKQDGKSVLGAVGGIENYRTAFGHWGDWGTPVECPEGSFVIGLKVKDEAYVGSADNVALTGMSMACRYSVVGGTYPEIPGNEGMTSTDYEHYLIADSPWGVWTGWTICSTSSYMCGFWVRIEANQGTSGDDTAMNGIRMVCCNMPWNV